jgi:hypothetical protein
LADPAHGNQIITIIPFNVVPATFRKVVPGDSPEMGSKPKVLMPKTILQDAPAAMMVEL